MDMDAFRSIYEFLSDGHSNAKIGVKHELFHDDMPLYHRHDFIEHTIEGLLCLPLC